MVKKCFVVNCCSNYAEKKVQQYFLLQKKKIQRKDASNSLIEKIERQLSRHIHVSNMLKKNIMKNVKTFHTLIALKI